MKTLFKSLLVTTTSFTLLLFMASAHTGADNPHIVTQQDSSCIVCHNNSPTISGNQPLMTKNVSVDQSQFKQDGVAMCASCHNPDQGHKVGLNIDFPVPADLPLNENNDITCLTCHYTHGNLSSERPQASFSFMDRLVNAERLHKSFLLRRNNSDGELCLTCHNVNQGSKQ